MAEMTEARRAAWQAEEDRKKEQRLKTDRDRKRNATQKAGDKVHAIFANVEDSERLQEQEWLRHYFGDANFNGAVAARMAGYAHDTAKVRGWRFKKKFAKKIAAHFESTYLQKSAVVASLVNTWKGPGEYIVVKKDHTGMFDTMDVAATMANLEEAGLLDIIKGMKNSQYGPVIEFRDPDAALGRIIQMTGLNAPVKIMGTLTLEGLTPVQIQEKANEVMAKIVERQQKLLNMPSDLEDIPEADLVDEDDEDIEAYRAAEAELDSDPD